MSTAAPDPSAPQPAPPPADPRAIRAALSSALAPQFDEEWRAVLERAQASQDLEELRALITKWRHTVHLETTRPGSYQGLLAKAENILTARHNPTAGSIDDHRALIRERLER